MLPSANADAPTPLSSLLLLAFHGIGESTDAPLAGMGRRVTAKPLLTIHRQLTAWSKRRRPGSPQ